MADDIFVEFSDQEYRRLVFILRNGWCIFCHHRSNYRPCALGLVPVTRHNKSCKHFYMWRINIQIPQGKGVTSQPS